MRPRLPLEEAVEMTVRWYRAATSEAAGMDEISCAQIHSYEQRLEFATNEMAKSE